MKKTILLFSISLMLLTGLFAASPLESYVGKKNAEILQKKGMLALVHPETDNSLSIVPECQYSQIIKRDLVTKSDNGVPFTAEYLYLIPKADLLKNSNKTEVTIEDVSVVLRSLSKMEGMRYHFNEKKNGDVLYKASYTVDGLNSEKKIPDQIEGSADGKVIYCYQKDHTYGVIKYKLNFYQNEDVVYASFENTSPLSYIGLKPVEEKKLHLNVMVLDCEDSIVLYLSTDVDAKKLPLFNIRKKMEESMTERMDAISRWFMVQF